MDWQHGELWLTADGLFRRPRGWAATVASDGIAHDLQARPADEPIEEELSEEELSKGLWIPAQSIRTASLRRGIMTGRLKLGLANGSTVKLLWVRSALTYRSIQDALQSWLAS
jgi:hypothetical protein